MADSKENNKQKMFDNVRLQQLLLIILIIIIGFLLIKNIELENESSSKVLFTDNASSSDADISSPIIVHIKGAVVNPGVYEISGDCRLKDAIDAAGGLKDNADKDVLNLAMFLNDGDEIVIPVKGEALTNSPSSLSRASIVTSSSSNSQNAARINLNTATLEQLTTLPGVGKSLAEQIIQYRKHIKFNSVSDLKNVPGIGNSKYDELSGLVYVK